MLSKSQAKVFFLIGTGVFAAIFAVLTIDTFQRIPKQTNSGEMNESVIRGKHLFEQKNCMGCHTILGEGAYYAPELTKVFERRGENFIKAMLRDPEAMYPGQRKMVNYRLNEQEITDLTSFLKWVGTMDLNGFPPKPDLAPPTSLQTGAPAVYSQTCAACHSLNGQGGQVGPALDGIGKRRDLAYIESWLRDPMAIKPESKMPKLPLTEEEIKSLSTFLSSQIQGEQ